MSCERAVWHHFQVLHLGVRHSGGGGGLVTLSGISEPAALFLLGLFFNTRANQGHFPGPPLGDFTQRSVQVLVSLSFSLFAVFSFFGRSYIEKRELIFHTFSSPPVPSILVGGLGFLGLGFCFFLFGWVMLCFGLPCVGLPCCLCLQSSGVRVSSAAFGTRGKGSKETCCPPSTLHKIQDNTSRREIDT